MRVVHLVSTHAPTDVRVFLKEARTLAKAGYEVTLVAPAEESKLLDGVHIQPVPKAKNRVERFILGIWRIYRAALAAKGEVYHFHDPDLIPIGLLLRLGGKKVIYDVHEDVPRDILSKHWIPVWLRRIIAKAMSATEWLAAGLLSGIVTATPAIARRFPPQKTVVIQNFPFREELVVEGSVSYTERPPNVGYVGGIEVIRGIREMVKAMECLPPALDAQLVLAGKFSPPGLAQEVQQMPGWERVKFLGWLGREQIADVLSGIRIGLVVLHPVPNFLESQPVKLFEYMSASIPVIAADFPLWRELVKGAGCGLLVDPLEPKAIAQAIQYLLEHPKEAGEMGLCGRLAVLEKYNWEVESQKLLEFYGRLV